MVVTCHPADPTQPPTPALTDSRQFFFHFSCFIILGLLDGWLIISDHFYQVIVVDFVEAGLSSSRLLQPCEIWLLTDDKKQSRLFKNHFENVNTTVCGGNAV